MRLLQEYENDYRADLLDGFVNSPFKGGDRLSKVGFIKDWRQELESDIWLMPPMYHRVWQWIKYSVNHSTGKIPNKDGTFTLIEPGQHATSYRLIAQGVGYYEGRKWKEPNVKTVKSILDWLVKQNMISVQSNSKGTIINVVNWGLYQSEIDKGNSERIAEETLEKHLVDTKKNDKECNNNDNNILPSEKEAKKDSKIKKTFNQDDKEYKLANYLSKQIAKRLDVPLKDEATLQRWAVEFDRMVRIDGYDIDDIKDVLVFSQRDPFWQTNIMSAGKFRKQYLVLLGKMRLAGD